MFSPLGSTPVPSVARDKYTKFGTYYVIQTRECTFTLCRMRMAETIIRVFQVLAHPKYRNASHFISQADKILFVN